MKDIFTKICQDSKLVGACSMVVKDGKIVEELSYGKSSIEDDRNCTCDTVFRIASVSKIMVGACIMQLYEKGLVDFKEDISKYLGFKVRNPKFPDVPITLNMVMTQTSSIRDGEEKGVNSTKDTGYNLVNGTSLEVSLEDLLLPSGKYWDEGTFNNYYPGTYFEYSNFGCGILACIVERITGEYFTDYIIKNIFNKLNLDASFRAPDIKSKDIASTYYPTKDGGVRLGRTGKSFVENAYPKFKLGESFRGPAGGLFISTRDLMKIMQCFIDGGEPIMKKETFDRMMQMTWWGSRRMDSSYTAKGLQLKIMDHFDGCRLYGHFGDAYGVKTFFLFNQKQKLGMIHMTNGGHYHYQKIGVADIHEKYISEVLKKYWTNDDSHLFTFKKGEKIGYVDGRKVELVYEERNNNLYFLPMTLLDVLNISCYQDFEKIEKSLKDKSLQEVLENNLSNYSYNCVVENDVYKISYQYKKQPLKIVDKSLPR